MNAQNIIDFLASQGIEIAKDVASKAITKFEAFVFVDTDSVLKDGQIAVTEASHKSKMDDLQSYKASSKKFEKQYKEIKSVLDSGDTHNAKLLESLKTTNERQQKIVNQFTADAKARWESGKESIPEALAKKFAVPKEGEELSDDDVFANLERLEEYREVNPEAFGIKASGEGDKKTLFSIPKTRKDGKPAGSAKDESWRDKTPSERMALLYKKQEEGSGVFPGARREESD